MERWHAASRQLLALQTGIDDADNTLEAALQRVVEGALAAVPGAAGAVIELLDDGALLHRVGSGEAARSIGLRLGLEGSLSGQCVRSGEAQLCTDSETDPRVDLAACRQTGVRSFIVAPIQLQGESIGVLKVMATEPNAFDERDIVVARLLTAPVALAIANAERLRLTHAHDALARRFAATFDQAAVGIAHVATDGRFLLVNQRFCQIIGYTPRELTEGGFQQITHPDDLAADLDNVAALLDRRIDSYAMEKRYVHKSGDPIWVNLTVSLVHTPDSDPDFFVSVIEDITKRKYAEALASYDPLTGLPNRRLVMEQLAQLIEAPGPLAVGYLDLNRFKRVNDRFGHGEGDRCLQTVADALRHALRGDDLVGRMAGDEFVLLLPQTDVGAASGLLARLQRRIEQLPEQARWDIGVSAGAIVVPPGMSPGIAEVIDAADRLMYRVKHDGGHPLVEMFNAHGAGPRRAAARG